jgi:DNA-directed RNA polymerase specialized sigma24 family protein
MRAGPGRGRGAGTSCLAQGATGTNLDQMASTALELRPALLSHARELTGRRADLDAEDLVSVALLAMVERPPHPRTPIELKHWLRTVLRNQAARTYRDLHGATFVTYEAVEEAAISDNREWSHVSR